MIKEKVTALVTKTAPGPVTAANNHAGNKRAQDAGNIHAHGVQGDGRQGDLRD